MSLINDRLCKDWAETAAGASKELKILFLET